jgi:hypothetical protein
LEETKAEACDDAEARLSKHHLPLLHRNPHPVSREGCELVTAQKPVLRRQSPT